MKKIISFVISVIILVFMCPVKSNAALYEPENMTASVYYMVNLDDGTVICEKNIQQRVAPASITKIVTAMVTIENCTDFEEIITVPSYAIHLLDGTNSSVAGIIPGEQLSIKDLLYSLLVFSANDAANILADYIGGGSIETFVEMMNNFVLKLGCNNTHFANAHGLDDPDHYTTAEDLFVIYKYCMENNMFSEIAGTLQYEIGPTNKYNGTRVFRNTNGLINPGIPDYYCEYVKNGKTGTTDNAGRCVISSASYDGYNYMCIVLNAIMTDCDDDDVDENMAFIEAKRLYNWAFDNLKIRVVADTSIYVCEAAVRLSKDYDYVSLVPAENISALVPYEVDSQSVLIEPYSEITVKTVDAPVKKGQVLGRASVKYAGEVIAEVNLVAAFSVKRSTVKFIGDIFLKIVKSTLFKIIAIVAVCVVLPCAIVLFGIVPAKRKKEKNKIHIVKVNDLSDDKK